MKREIVSAATTVVVVLDGDTDAGYRTACELLADGHRVAVIARHPAHAVRVLHGQSFDRVMVIAADVSDRRQWAHVVERVADRFGLIDAVVTAEDNAMRASA